jgi:acetate kinase
MDVLPNIPHVAIMDTAWHQTMPAHVYMYALPYEWYEKYGVRRYGFRGTSFLYVAKRAALLLGKDPFQTNLVCLHIGNGVSANAIKNGVSYDTSMGLTPLEGLEFMGIKLDKAKNALAKTRNAETEISAADSKVKVFVIPTDEERVNIKDVIAILEGKYDEHTRFTYRFQSPAYENSQREQDFQKECEKKPGLKSIQVKPKK